MWRIQTDSRASPRRTIESNRQWKTPELKTANGRRNKMFGSYNYTAIYVARLVIYSVSDYYFPSQGCKLAVITEMRNWKRRSLECNSDTCARSISTHLYSYFYKKNSQLHVAATNIQQLIRFTLLESESYPLQRRLLLEIIRSQIKFGSLTKQLFLSNQF